MSGVIKGNWKRVVGQQAEVTCTITWQQICSRGVSIVQRNPYAGSNW